MTKGAVGVWDGLKKDDVIYEQPLSTRISLWYSEISIIQFCPKKALPKIQNKKCFSLSVTVRECKNLYLFGKSDRIKVHTPVEMIKFNKEYS